MSMGEDERKGDYDLRGNFHLSTTAEYPKCGEKLSTNDINDLIVQQI
jgi:hypothetical protein